MNVDDVIVVNTSFGFVRALFVVSMHHGASAPIMHLKIMRTTSWKPYKSRMKTIELHERVWNSGANPAVAMLPLLNWPCIAARDPGPQEMNAQTSLEHIQRTLEASSQGSNGWFEWMDGAIKSTPITWAKRDSANGMTDRLMEKKPYWFMNMRASAQESCALPNDENYNWLVVWNIFYFPIYWE